MGSWVDPGGAERERMEQSNRKREIIGQYYTEVSDLILKKKPCRSNKAASFADEEKFLPTPLKT